MEISLGNTGPQRLQKPAPSKQALLDSILKLGNFYELNVPIDVPGIEKSLAKFSEQWVQYNPYKPNIARKALSLTSLDGGMSGKPDLYSLSEYYRREGVLYKESDFRGLTPVYQECTGVHPLLNHFLPHLGRTHFLKFGAGGYFPPHRDGAWVAEPDVFRIIVPVSKINHASFVLIFDRERVPIQLGQAYFMNTLLSHSVFSFADDAVLLVCNVILSEESVKKLHEIVQDR